MFLGSTALSSQSTFRGVGTQGLSNGARDYVIKGPQEESRMGQVAGTVDRGLWGNRMSAGP